MNNNNINCKILDDDEIEIKEKPQFRVWNVDASEKRTFPFDRYQKKEFPFLFKKKSIPKEENSKISLDEIITKVKDLSMNSPVLHAIQENVDLPELELNNRSSTPPYAPVKLTQEEVDFVKQLDLDLKSKDVILKDGTQ